MQNWFTLNVRLRTLFIWDNALELKLTFNFQTKYELRFWSIEINNFKFWVPGSTHPYYRITAFDAQCAGFWINDILIVNEFKITGFVKAQDCQPDFSNAYAWIHVIHGFCMQIALLIHVWSMYDLFRIFFWNPCKIYAIQSGKSSNPPLMYASLEVST